jgi:uncharacterized protein (TIGR02266 family)
MKLEVPVDVATAAPLPVAEPPPPESPPSAAPAQPDLETAVDIDTDSNFYTGLSRDIGSGGLFVATRRVQRIGDRLHVQFTLPDVPAPIRADTEVRWTRSEATSDADHPPGIGLRFLHLPLQAKETITSFMERRESIFYDDE